MFGIEGLNIESVTLAGFGMIVMIALLAGKILTEKQHEKLMAMQRAQTEFWESSSKAWEAAFRSQTGLLNETYEGARLTTAIVAANRDLIISTQQGESDG